MMQLEERTRIRLNSSLGKSRSEDSFLHRVMWRLFRIHIHKWIIKRGFFGEKIERNCKCGTCDIMNSGGWWRLRESNAT